MEVLRSLLGRMVVGDAAELRNHVRIFCGVSTVWQGARASLWRKANGVVLGKVVWLDDIELERLDKYECKYQRERRWVWADGGKKKVLAWVYVVKKEGEGFVVGPSPKYIKAIEVLLEEVGWKDKGGLDKWYGIVNGRLRNVQEH